MSDRTGKSRSHAPSAGRSGTSSTSRRRHGGYDSEPDPARPYSRACVARTFSSLSTSSGGAQDTGPPNPPQAALHLQDARGRHPARAARPGRGSEHRQDVHLQRRCRDLHQGQDREDARHGHGAGDAAADLLAVPGHPDQPAAGDHSRSATTRTASTWSRPSTRTGSSSSARPFVHESALKDYRHEIGTVIMTSIQLKHIKVDSVRNAVTAILANRNVEFTMDVPSANALIVVAFAPERLRAGAGHRRDGRPAGRGDAQVRADPPRARGSRTNWCPSSRT